MSLKLNSSGGGSVTLQEPSTASNLTLTLPTTTGTAVIQDASNNLLMNSGYGSDAVAYGCRAWVNFNGTGTVAIRASGNVSSITDHGTGQFSINFTVAMPDTNYAAVGTGGASGNSDAVGVQCPNIIATSSYRFGVTNSGGTLSDRDTNYVAIFR
jgi:hypothetical protein